MCLNSFNTHKQSSTESAVQLSCLKLIHLFLELQSLFSKTANMACLEVMESVTNEIQLEYQVFNLIKYNQNFELKYK